MRSLALIGLTFLFAVQSSSMSFAQSRIITTVAGNGSSGYSGDGGPATSALLNFPMGVAVDSAGNLFIADDGNACIRKVSLSGIITTVAGNGSSGYGGDGGPATSAMLHSPRGVAVDSAGNLFIADTDNYRIRKVSSSGIITTVAGNGSSGFGGDGGPATSALLNFPRGVAVDSAGNLFIADDGDSRIRKVSSSGIITTVAGNGSSGFGGDGGPATSAQLHSPRGVALDSSGNLFIADADNYRIRKVSPSGIITTVAGNGSSGYGGDGGPATSALLDFPVGVAVDSAGNLFIADDGDSRIREVSSSGIITTVAGNGSSGFGGDGGPATSAQLHSPRGVVVDSTGNLFIADADNYRIRMVAGVGGVLAFIPPMAVGLGRFGTSGGWVTTHANKEGGYATQSWIRLPWDAYNATGGGVHLAMGDVDGDGLNEYVMGLDSGGGGWIAILDDSSHQNVLLKWIQVEWNTYNAGNGEVFPAVGDLDGDGKAEIVAGLGTGGQGWIEIFGNASTGYRHLEWRQISWSDYNTANGTVHPAVGDLDGDGKSEIILGLANAGGGWIEVLQSAAGGYAHQLWLQVHWPEYNSSNGTTWPAAGDIDGDGRAEIVIGLGQGSQGWIEFLDDQVASYASLKWFQIPWDAYNSANGETHPAAGNLDADSRSEIVFGLGRFAGHGGWLFALDDATSGYGSLGWFQVPWNAFAHDGGETFPALSILNTFAVWSAPAAYDQRNDSTTGSPGGDLIHFYARSSSEATHFLWEMNGPITDSSVGFQLLIVEFDQL